MQRMGICGTDVHYFERGPVGKFGKIRPFVLGHEGAGEVVEVGSNVTDLTIGTRVAIDPSRPCHTCRYCMSGRYNLCPNMQYLGSASSRPPDGLFCEYLAFPAPNCYPLPDSFSYGEAAMIEPLSVAMHAIKRAGDISGLSVLIAGGGPIGQLALLVARAFGAAQVALSEVVETRRKFAMSNGANLALDPVDPWMIQQALDFTDGGFDLIIEAAGSGAALSQAFEIARPGGTLIQIGGIKADAHVPLNRVMPRELNYIGSFRFANVFQMAISMAASRRIDLSPLISETLPLDEFRGAIELAQAREGVVKVQLTTT
ncbi:alcohol dehydrogenase catalytic domain-containing protein [Chloroflexi bacterium TSY]|nr:alcohol dehydrogenase catalytic domain-containing protein [Chloroflexi bacterium TSY]